MTGKDFTSKAKEPFNPALAFITQQPEAAPEPATTEPATITPMKRLYVETKSKRVQLLMQPTLHKRLKRLANEQGLSFNEFIHSTLEAYADEEEKRGL